MVSNILCVLGLKIGRQIDIRLRACSTKQHQGSLAWIVSAMAKAEPFSELEISPLLCCPVEFIVPVRGLRKGQIG